MLHFGVANVVQVAGLLVGITGQEVERVLGRGYLMVMEAVLKAEGDAVGRRVLDKLPQRAAGRLQVAAGALRRCLRHSSRNDSTCSPSRTPASKRRRSSRSEAVIVSPTPPR